MPRKILRSSFKNNTLCCFFTAFDSPRFILRKNNKGALKRALPCYFWWTRGEVALGFCEGNEQKWGSVCLAKSFGHRSKTTHCVVFSLRSIPLVLFCEKITREHSKEHSLAIFGGLEGNRTPVRKPLDMTFSVGSQFLLFPTTRRQLTGSE